MRYSNPYTNVVQVISLKKWPRATIAKRLSESYLSKVHVTLTMEADILAVKKAREQLKEKVKKEYNARLTYTALFVKLVAHALRKHLILNSIVEGDEAKVIGDINISVAVQSPKLGLVVPVVRQVDTKPIGQVALELNTIAEKAREGKITIDEMMGGTFTITNLGMLRSVDAFTPIINPPQSAILGIGRIIEKPWVVNGKIEIRPTCTFSLTHDHRVIDGYPAAEFLATLKSILENPMEYLGE